MLTQRGPGLLPIFYILPCNPDSRANRIESWSFRPNGGMVTIMMCTAGDVVDALTAALTRLGHRVFRLEVTDPDDRRKWTHAIEIAAPPSQAVEDLLNLFKETLVLVRQPGVESAMALDWYKDPASDEDPNKWAYTDIGNVVAACKYGGNVQALKGLVARLADVIDRHPIYRECVLATVPGHNTKIPSIGERVAAGVAERLGRPLIRTTARTAVRPEAKSGEKFDLTGEFSMDETAKLQGVLIVDDLYHSGKTMGAVAAAAKSAGALSVHGIAGVRIMRK